MAAACEKDSLLSQYEGGVNFDIKMLAASRTNPDDGGSDGFIPEKVLIKIYRSDGELIRRYDEMSKVPSPLYLVAGSYRVSVEAGNKNNVAFKEPATNDERKQMLCYAGSNTFEITKNNTSDITVDCPTINSQVLVNFDKTDSEQDNLNSLYENRFLTDVKIKVAAISADGVTNFETLSAKVDEADAPCLEFTYANDDANGGQQSGYFIMPEGVTTLIWAFKANHPDDGVIDAKGTVSANVDAGKAYKVNFKYARTLDGAGGIRVSIDESVVTFEDVYSFKPQPEITGDGFDVMVANAFKDQAITLYCESIYNLHNLSLGDTSFLVNGTVVDNHGIAGLACEKQSETKVKITLAPEFFTNKPGGEVKLSFNMQDIDGDKVSEVYLQELKFMKQGLWENATEFNLWTNMANFAAVVTEENASTVQIRYRKQGAAEWNVVDAEKQSDNLTYKAVSLSPWTVGYGNGYGHTIYDPVPSKGIYANNTYEYELLVDGQPVSSATRSMPVTQVIPGADFEDESMDCFQNTSTDGNAYPWGSGTNKVLTTLNQLCFYDTEMTGKNNNACARLKAKEAGVGTITKLAAGNLFLGSFKMVSTSGTVSFGIPYKDAEGKSLWKARPTSLKLKYYTNFGIVNRNDQSMAGADAVENLSMGDPDYGSIYVAIVDWDERHGVTSGTGPAEGVWSPEDGMNPTDSEGKPVGKIIGYGVVYPRGKTNGDSMIDLEIPIHYYDKVSKPSKNFTLVIAAATSRYGDYMLGCSSSTMYVDNFQWGFDEPTNLYDEAKNQTLPQE